MATFRIRDLMVSVRPADNVEQAEDDDLAGRVCGCSLAWTYGCGCSRQHTCIGNTECGGCTLEVTNWAGLACPRQSCQGNSDVCDRGTGCPGGGVSCQAGCSWLVTRTPVAAGGWDLRANAPCPRQSCQGNSDVCQPGTGCPGGGVSCQAGCSWLVTRTPAFDGCGHLSDLRNMCLYSQPPDIAVLGQPELAALKEQLAVAMQQVELREEVLRRQAAQAARPPQTVAEIDALERDLTEALEELRARRTELEQTPAAEAEPRRGK